MHSNFNELRRSISWLGTFLLFGGKKGEERKSTLKADKNINSLVLFPFFSSFYLSGKQAVQDRE